MLTLPPTGDTRDDIKPKWLIFMGARTLKADVKIYPVRLDYEIYCLALTFKIKQHQKKIWILRKKKREKPVTKMSNLCNTGIIISTVVGV